MQPHILTEWDMVIRLCISFGAGAIIGFERSSHHQVAGLRTHILITTGAALLMLLSIWLPQEFSGMKNGDPGRIAAQVVSGIGFLGAGAIIRLGNNVRGLTTAASLWFMAAVGLTIGAGMFIAAAIAEALGLITLFVLGVMERKVFPSEQTKMLELIYDDSNPSTKEAMDIITAAGIRIQSMDMRQSSKGKATKLKILAGIPNTVDIATIAKLFKTSGNVRAVEIKEKY
ncbi:MgtC/SapB family protein [Leadbettera azotonutricia]|uniref:MgtC family protein n=1 Tax=Leadbettera azotonutricia (strain ATCC BAA-888 / DSM 13862 / ZAS-9) TaxID=545695 RepID=F5Y918_LEAAZ|nr:MgtC/SapB family protein [Leadbettera azotonutricia]AEF81784.1 MgtC family protein [Leadbettera azotonutricia ZAS-9]